MEAAVWFLETSCICRWVSGIELLDVHSTFCPNCIDDGWNFPLSQISPNVIRVKFGINMGSSYPNMGQNVVEYYKTLVGGLFHKEFGTNLECAQAGVPHREYNSTVA